MAPPAIWSQPSKIVLAIDIGTTQSAVSYAYLYPGGPQVVHRITGWPGQGAQQGQTKIPTLIWYDQNRQAVEFGAKAESPEALEAAANGGWQLAKHFKLHLHPRTMRTFQNIKTEELPSGITIRQIYVDFMKYLLSHTSEMFKARELDGKRIWDKYFKTADIVITHPNGWGLEQQHFLRQAAVDAGFTTSANARVQICFVTEGEASVHFCAAHADLTRLRPGVTFTVCDAGGSTIDITSYSVTQSEPILELQEAKPSSCIQAGAIYVDAAAEKHLRKVLSSTAVDPEDANEYVKDGVKDFEQSAKRTFDIDSGDQYIFVGNTRFHDSLLGIRRGRMKLSNAVIYGFFEECLKKISHALHDQIAGLSIEHLLLVGGFGESPLLRRHIADRFGVTGCNVTLVNEPSSKAVADGGVLWNIKRSVIARSCQMTFGIEIRHLYDAGNQEHRTHGRKYDTLDGLYYVHGGWFALVEKGDQVRSDQEIFCPFWRTAASEAQLSLGVYSSSIYTSEHASSRPLFLLDPKGVTYPGFVKIGNVQADLSGLSGALEKCHGPSGPYVRLIYDIGLAFGGPEIVAFLRWKEKGLTRRGPATIIPNSLLF